MTKIAVFGAGSWGSALAIHFARVTNKVILYTPEKTVVDEINNHKTNTTYLPEIVFSSNIFATNNLEDILNSDILVIAIPSKAFRIVIQNLLNNGLSIKTILLIATKGLLHNPVVLFSDFLTQIPNKFAFIYGPNFAKEVATGLYSATTIGCVDLTMARDLAQITQTENFIVDITNDIITIQIASIIKNIVAILYGMNEALGVKENQKAALIVDALKEIKILSNALGGIDDTLLNYGVLGDLVLTCYSKTSRNVQFGYKFVNSEDKPLFLKEFPYLVEGRESISSLIDLAKQYNVNLPVINSIYKNLNEG